MSIPIPDQEHSLWQASPEADPYPELTTDIETEVAVVGGGISGLTSAYLLKQSGLKVVVVEKDSLAAGSTGKTTGKVTSQHNLIYHTLRSRLGAQTAATYAQANQEAIGRIKAIIARQQIDCDWQDDDHYVYTADPSRVVAFKEEAEAARACGLPASFETSTPLPFKVKAAVKFTGQGKMNARRYVQGLARAVQGGGCHIFEGTRAIGIRDGQPATVKTPSGTIRARHVVVTTKVPTFPLLARGGYGLYEYPQFSYLVAGRPKLDLRGMYISPDSSHYSILPISVAGQRYVLVGGENHIPGTRFNFRARHQRLADYAQRHFGVGAIKYRWKAWDYLGYDDLPLAGRLYPWSRHLYATTGLMKWGLTNHLVCATVLHDLITGQANPWIQTFSPHRRSLLTSIPHAAFKYLRP
jgi:glycine/D-amino acid oxidase-like deaminating enzyme